MSKQVFGQEFKISKALITAERLGVDYDLKQMIGEVSFFEDLEKAYVTAQLVIIDDAGTFNEMKIKGSEQIEITIEGVEQEFIGTSFTHKFNIVSIIQVQKGGNRSEIYHLNCISPHAYRDQGIKISRSYTGKIEDICEAVLDNHLDTDLNMLDFTGNEPSRQDPIRIITPYISPLETVEWLIDRASTAIGAPYYVYCTLYDQKEGVDKLRLGDLEYMLNKTPFNASAPLLYSQARGQEVAGKSLKEQAVIVKDFSVENVQDQMKMMQEGAVGAMMSSYDVFTSQRYSRHFKVSDLLEKMEGAGMMHSREQNVFDTEQTLEYEGDTKKSDEWDHRYFNTITSFGTYGSVNSYHDVFDQSQALNKLRTGSIKSMLNKNMIDVTLPGVLFFALLVKQESAATVGDLVDIEFQNTNVEDPRTDETANKELSGTYLIHKVRNVFTSTRHDVVLSVSKVAEGKPELS
jgi:hypothetical protein